MRAIIAGFCLGLFLCGMATAEDKKKWDINIDKQKQEGTMNLNNSGTWQGGATKPPQAPESSQTEKDKREQQQNQGGQVFIRKTF